MKLKNKKRWKKMKAYLEQTMIVAVAVPLSPPQHSPMLGHLASSQTCTDVCISPQANVNTHIHTDT